MAMDPEEGKTSSTFGLVGTSSWSGDTGRLVEMVLLAPLKEVNQAQLMLCLVAVPLVFVVIETSWAFPS